MNTTYTTPDLSVAAYLAMKGMRLIKASKTSSGRFEFVFDDPNNEAESMTLEYFNSEFCTFDNNIRIFVILKIVFNYNKAVLA